MPGAEVLAIEPLPKLAVRLRLAAAAAQKNVCIVAMAMWDSSGAGWLKVPLVNGAPVWEWASVVKDFQMMRGEFPEITGERSFSVELRTLDSLDLHGITAIKLDAEGAEYKVLRGALDTLARNRPIISAEIEERHQPGCTYAVPAFMDGLDYDCYFEIGGVVYPFERFERATMQRGGRSPANHDYSDPYINCFYFLPRENQELRQRLSKAYRLAR